jgi:hypothetical protein
LIFADYAKKKSKINSLYSTLHLQTELMSRSKESHHFDGAEPKSQDTKPRV